MSLPDLMTDLCSEPFASNKPFRCRFCLWVVHFELLHSVYTRLHPLQIHTCLFDIWLDVRSHQFLLYFPSNMWTKLMQPQCCSLVVWLSVKHVISHMVWHISHILKMAAEVDASFKSYWAAVPQGKGLKRDYSSVFGGINDWFVFFSLKWGRAKKEKSFLILHLCFPHTISQLHSSVEQRWSYQETAFI